MEGVFCGDAHAHVAVVVTKEQHSHGWNFPTVVCVVEVSLHLVGVGAPHVAQALHFGEDALLDTVFGQLVGILAETLVVGDDNKVFATFGTVVHPLLHTSFIIDSGKLVVVGQVLHENGIPIGRTQAGVAKFTVAAVKAHVELKVIVHTQLFSHRVVLVGRHSDGHGLNATQAERLGDRDGLRREEGVSIVNAQVLLVSIGAVVSVKLYGGGGKQVDILDG